MSRELNAARRLLEADLLSGLVVLDGYVRNGLPDSLRRYAPDPRAETAAVFDAIEPTDLTREAAGVYTRLRDLWRAGKPLDSLTLPDWAQPCNPSNPLCPTQCGHRAIGAGYLARIRAREILEIRAHLSDRWRGLKTASEAEEQLQQLGGRVR